MNLQELQEQQLPVKLQTEEVEEFQDAVEVHSIAGHCSAEFVSVYFCCKWENYERGNGAKNDFCCSSRRI